MGGTRNGHPQGDINAGANQQTSSAITSETGAGRLAEPIQPILTELLKQVARGDGLAYLLRQHDYYRSVYIPVASSWSPRSGRHEVGVGRTLLPNFHSLASPMVSGRCRAWDDPTETPWWWPVDQEMPADLVELALSWRLETLYLGGTGLYTVTERFDSGTNRAWTVVDGEPWVRRPFPLGKGGSDDAPPRYVLMIRRAVDERDADTLKVLVDDLVERFVAFRERYFTLGRDRPYVTAGFHREWIASILRSYYTGGKTLILSPPATASPSCWCISPCGRSCGTPTSGWRGSRGTPTLPGTWSRPSVTTWSTTNGSLPKPCPTVSPMPLGAVVRVPCGEGTGSGSTPSPWSARKPRR